MCPTSEKPLWNPSSLWARLSSPTAPPSGGSGQLPLFFPSTGWWPLFCFIADRSTTKAWECRDAISDLTFSFFLPPPAPEFSKLHRVAVSAPPKLCRAQPRPVAKGLRVDFTSGATPDKGRETCELTLARSRANSAFLRPQHHAGHKVRRGRGRVSSNNPS